MTDHSGVIDIARNGVDEVIRLGKRVAELEAENAYLRAANCDGAELAQKLQVERNALRLFAQCVMESWPYGDVDGFELQDAAVRCGLLALKDPRPTEPCGDFCECSGYPWQEEWTEGIDCYVRTPLLTGVIGEGGGNG
jgi:hypothetical protein